MASSSFPPGEVPRDLRNSQYADDAGTAQGGSSRALSGEPRKRSNQFAAMRRIALGLPSGVSAGLASVKSNIGEGIESARDGTKHLARRILSRNEDRGAGASGAAGSGGRLQRTRSGTALTTATEVLPSMITMWNKPIDELPVCKDLPRLCRRVTVKPFQGPLYYEPSTISPDEEASNKRAVELTGDIILAVVHALEGLDRIEELRPQLAVIAEEASETIEPETLVRRMLALVGDDSPSVRLLKTVHQDIVGHCTYQLKQHITSRFMTKDVRTPEGWRIGMSFLGDGGVQVSHTRREQSIDPGGSKVNHWEFEWELRLLFNPDVTEMQSAQLRVTDLFLSQTIDPQLEADIKHDLLGEDMS